MATSNASRKTVSTKVDLKKGDVVESGLWVDTKTGAVVTSEPEEGRQIVAPGTPASEVAVTTLAYYQDPDGDDKETATLTAAPESR